MEGGLLNAREAASYLNMSPPTFYKRHKRNLKRYRVGGKGLWLYRISDLQTIRDGIEVDAA